LEVKGHFEYCNAIKTKTTNQQLPNDVTYKKGKIPIPQSEADESHAQICLIFSKIYKEGGFFRTYLSIFHVFGQKTV
jgi:hypothetical protein